MWLLLSFQAIFINLVRLQKGNDIITITDVAYINRYVLYECSLIIVLKLEASYLPFLNIESRSTVSNLTGVDDGTRSVTLPSQLHFGNNTFTTAYVSVIWYILPCL